LHFKLGDTKTYPSYFLSLCLPLSWGEKGGVKWGLVKGILILLGINLVIIFWIIYSIDHQTPGFLREHGGKTGEELKAEGK
jgi:uncharacterized membrane protein